MYILDEDGGVSTQKQDLRNANLAGKNVQGGTFLPCIRTDMDTLSYARIGSYIRIGDKRIGIALFGKELLAVVSAFFFN